MLAIAKGTPKTIMELKKESVLIPNSKAIHNSTAWLRACNLVTIISTPLHPITPPAPRSGRTPHCVCGVWGVSFPRFRGACVCGWAAL